jgi:hypothetical protein
MYFFRLVMAKIYLSHERNFFLFNPSRTIVSFNQQTKPLHIKSYSLSLQTAPLFLFCCLPVAILFTHTADYSIPYLWSSCSPTPQTTPLSTPFFIWGHPVLPPCGPHPCLFYSLAGSSCSPTLRVTLLSIYYTLINFIS